MRFLFLFFVLISGTVQSQNYSKRLALIIGNSTYQNGGALKNPVNDARAMASALEAVGFEVMKYENVTQIQLKQAINSYGQKLKQYQVGLFYYAGHGIQHKGSNYMIPVEADLQAEEQIEFDCVAADRVLAYMESAATKLNILIMDACRNNPFERSWHRSVEGNGLAMMNAPTGSLIAYATAPGRVASDGQSANGLYTSALLKYMKDPGLNIEQVFKRVRTEVSEKSFGAQIPWETTSLTGGDFYFVPNTSVAAQVKISNAGTAAVDFYSKGTDSYDAKKYEEAIVHYSKALELNPLYIEASLWRAHSYYALTRYTEAILDYNKVLELSPGESQAYYYRALCKYYLEQISEALADFSLSIKFDPRNTNAFYWRGYCYYVKGNYYAAIDDYSKTITLSPEYAAVYYNRGLSNYNVKEYASAISDFSEAIRLKYENPDVYYWKGNSAYMAADYKNAVTDYDSYLALKPTAHEGYYWRAYAYYYLKQNDKALQDINKALQLKPDEKDYVNFRRDILKK